MVYLDTETGNITDAETLAVAMTGHNAVTDEVDVEIAKLVIAGVLVPVFEKAA